jgi:hypothetical protein
VNRMVELVDFPLIPSIYFHENELESELFNIRDVS